MLFYYENVNSNSNPRYELMWNFSECMYEQNLCIQLTPWNGVSHGKVIDTEQLFSCLKPRDNFYILDHSLSQLNPVHTLIQFFKYSC
jgi:hypothetical protein